MTDARLRPDSSISAIESTRAPRFGEVQIRQRGHLPHWETEAGLYFITFRLADSLPVAVVQRIAERHRILQAAKEIVANLLPSQKATIERFSPKRLEDYFDRGAGSCFLRNPQIAELVANAFRWGDSKRYRLLAWCVMPNHVHAIFRLLPGVQLSDVVRSWKTYTARAANRLLGRTGNFWQREYYDRLIRKEGELDRAVDYVVNNPIRAGLAGWKWVWSAGLEARTTAGLETGATRRHR
jgi:REP element-mobilizing transposase RayT